ncbi:MAG: hypothetical protein ACTHPD_05460 [Rhizomicrobium sp.]
MPENRQKRPNWRTGAPNGNRNALKHGRHTKDARALRARIRDFKRRVKIALAMVDALIATQSPPPRGEADKIRSVAKNFSGGGKRQTQIPPTRIASLSDLPTRGR